MTVPSYITPQDLVDGLGFATYMAIFDDVGPGGTSTGDRTQVDPSTGVQTVLGTSLQLVASWLPDIYTKLPPETGAAGVPAGGDNIPRLYKFAQLQYAKLLAYQRHPEYSKTYGAATGGSMEKTIEALMRRIADGTQRATPNDTPPEPKPENIGGSTIADGTRIAITSNDGSTTNTGDW